MGQNITKKIKWSFYTFHDLATNVYTYIYIYLINFFFSFYSHNFVIDQKETADQVYRVEGAISTCQGEVIMQLGVMQYTFDSRVPPCHLNHRSYQRHHYERRVHPPPKIVEKSLCCRILSLIVHLNEFRPLFDDSHVAVRRAGRIFWQLHGGVLVLCNRYWYCWNFFTMVMA